MWSPTVCGCVGIRTTELVLYDSLQGLLLSSLYLLADFGQRLLRRLQ